MTGCDTCDGCTKGKPDLWYTEESTFPMNKDIIITIKQLSMFLKKPPCAYPDRELVLAYVNAYGPINSIRDQVIGQA